MRKLISVFNCMLMMGIFFSCTEASLKRNNSDKAIDSCMRPVKPSSKTSMKRLAEKPLRNKDYNIPEWQVREVVGKALRSTGSLNLAVSPEIEKRIEKSRQKRELRRQRVFIDVVLGLGNQERPAIYRLRHPYL